MDEATDRTAELMDQWLDSVVVWWDRTGTSYVLAGPEAGPLPGGGEVVHVLTAQDPGGERQPPERNRTLLGGLLRWAAHEVGDVGERWWPATGTSPGAGTYEQGVVVAGADRATAAGWGRHFAQLAIYEATPQALRVVTCADGALAEEVPRRWPGRSPAVELPGTVLDRWWATYRAVGREVGVVITEARFA